MTPDDLSRLQALEAEFDEAVRALIKRTITETPYYPARFMQMVTELGCLGAVRALLAQDLLPNQYHEGLMRLWDLRRLDLSVERLVAYGLRWTPLFSELERTRARARLNELGYREPAKGTGGGSGWAG